MTSTLDVGAPSPPALTARPRTTSMPRRRSSGPCSCPATPSPRSASWSARTTSTAAPTARCSRPRATLYDRGEPLDEVTLADELESRCAPGGRRRPPGDRRHRRARAHGRERAVLRAHRRRACLAPAPDRRRGRDRPPRVRRRARGRERRGRRRGRALRGVGAPAARRHHRHEGARQQRLRADRAPPRQRLGDHRPGDRLQGLRRAHRRPAARQPRDRRRASRRRESRRWSRTWRCTSRPGCACPW